MYKAEETLARLAGIPNLIIEPRADLSRHTRFGLGGRCDALVDAGTAAALATGIAALRAAEAPFAVIGGGTNLIVADEGFPGIVLRYTSRRLRSAGNRVSAGAGAVLDDLVDFANAHGLGGLETLAGIPGWVGGAVYGNAGAYGHSISERIRRVRFFDGNRVRALDNPACEFQYRESIFKRRKDWIVFSCDLALDPADPAGLLGTSAGIREIRNRKFPPSMRCAGSIFKNFLLTDLPPRAAAAVPREIVRDGKVPAAYFLEQAGAKGMRRGGIQVSDYHANLVFNAAGGNSSDLCALIRELKSRVADRFGITAEEEVQYIGFSPTTDHAG